MGCDAGNLTALQRTTAPYYAVHEMAHGDCPAHFFIGAPTDRAPAQLRDPPSLATGRGLDRARALGGCLGEIAEALCLSQPDERGFVRARASELDDAAIFPGELAAHGPRQLANRKQWNARYGDHDWICEPFDPATSIDWIRFRNISGDSGLYVPAAYCYLDHRESPPSARIATADSNGCAVAWSLEEAALRGFLELVERDAAAIWWYGMHRRPAVDLQSVGGAGLQKVRAWHESTGRSLRVLDLTTDIAIPVYVAISTDGEGRNVALGFAAALNTADAIVAAISEMLQLELSMSLVAATQRSGKARETTGTRTLESWRQLVSTSRSPYLIASRGEQATPRASPVDTKSLDEALAWCEQQCRRAGLSLWMLDMSRGEFPVRAVRAVVPGLCHYKARLGARRLFEVPRVLEWPSPPRSEEQLNDVPLLI